MHASQANTNNKPVSGCGASFWFLMYPGEDEAFQPGTSQNLLCVSLWFSDLGQSGETGDSSGPPGGQHVGLQRHLNLNNLCGQRWGGVEEICGD